MFNRFLTTSIIKVAWILMSALMIVLIPVLLQDNLEISSVSVVFIIIGVLLGWRVFCEYIILFFEINDKLADIRQLNRKIVENLSNQDIEKEVGGESGSEDLEKGKLEE